MDEVPQVGADIEGTVANFDPASVDGARWRLLATKHVKQAAATPTMGGADQEKWNLCDRRVVTTNGGVLLCDDMSVQQLPYAQLYRSLPGGRQNIIVHFYQRVEGAPKSVTAEQQTDSQP